MQAMRWSLEYPDRLKHCIVIAAAMKLSAQNLAFNELARQAIVSDPAFEDGNYIYSSQFEITLETQITEGVAMKEKEVSASDFF